LQILNMEKLPAGAAVLFTMALWSVTISLGITSRTLSSRSAASSLRIATLAVVRFAWTCSSGDDEALAGGYSQKHKATEWAAREGFDA
jgi:hypothetical protein